MWTPVTFTSDNSVPPSRSKHSAAVHGNHIYVVGGRNGNWPLKDIWRYALSNNTWEQLHPTGDSLQNLQEHTAVVYQDKVYVFGGEVGFSSASESPLWSYSIKDNQWKKVKGKSGSNVPKGRRGHTALVYRNSMIIYGGYRDLKGSTNEMWAYHFDTDSWHLLSQGRVLPPARHKHSAIIHDDVMWVYGGMTDLHERSDLWKFDFVKKKWSVLKTKVNPGLLHGHSASKVMGSMIIFGGKKGGQISNDLWKFYFATETWEKVHTTYPQPPPICEAVTLTVSETTSISTTKSNRENGVQSPIVSRRSRSGRSADRQQQSGNGDHGGHSHQWHHQCRSESRTSSLGGSNVNILKEISKLSQLNLYRLAHNKTYSVLSSTDSVLSADASHVQQQQQNMVKSQSANVIARSLISPVVSNASPPGYKSSFPPCRMPRDPMSVPNFGVALTPVEATKLVYLEGEEAPSPRVEFDHDFGSVHMRFHPNGPMSSGSSTLNKTLNRRSYPMTSSASARFGNPYSTPEEPGDITSGYVSIETVHQSPNSGDGPMCFSNPNYMVSDIQNAISKGDYVKLNSPPDSLLEDSDNAFEMREMNRPAPPKTLALNSSTAFNSSSDVRSSTKSARAASAGRVSAMSRGGGGGGGAVVEHHQVKEYAVYLLGGMEHDGSVTVFKKPMAVWKLSMFFRNVQ